MVEVLSARPPTPPRTSRTEDSPVVFQTPKDTPSFSANGSTGNCSNRHSKRVNFSPWTRYIKPPTFNSSTTFKALPPSNKCKPTKSILKTTAQSPSPVSSLDVSSCTPDSFVMLLESITQQLAGESMSSRQDAYMQFLGALKAYEGLPGEQEISGRLGQITQFIQRDISRDLENGGPLDINLVIYALKLAITFIWHPQISTHLPDDFRIFLVEHSISCLQDAKVPKSVLVHYMHVLSSQNFNSKIMTNARLIRLIAALHDITNRVNGNAVVLQRLSIYQRALNQSKSIFVSQSGLWVEHLISGLLHPVKDTRLKAISLGFQTSMAVGPNPTLSKNMRDVFDRSIDKGRKLVSEVCERMSRMMASVESGVHVPQVWSIIILLLRNKKSSVEQWEHFKEWVLILQKCFNCSEAAIKAQAILGWNRFVFAVGPNETTSRPMLKMLSKPVLSQFERKKQEKPGTQPSQLALSSYYNLLYYAFRPSASYQHFDVVWQEYIELPSSSIFSSVPILCDRICLALSSLMWSSQGKVWTENKVNESSKLDPEELPSLDCKWIRSRVSSVLKAFESLLKSSVWIDDAVDKSNMAAAWMGLSRALSHASSKEITPSSESMQAVASVLGLLQRLWNTGPSSVNAAGDHCMDKFFERFRFLSTTMIFSIGSIPFTEKLLLKTPDETFQAANTPQHRHSPTDRNLGSPMLHLLRLISGIPGISEPTPSYMHLIEGTLEAACNERASRGSRLELLRQCADLYPSSEAGVHPGLYKYPQIIWKVIAKFSADCLCSFPIESARERDGSISRDYENIVKILSSGLGFSGVLQEWNQLLDSFVRVLRTEKGDRAIATTVIEPLAEHMMLYRAEDTYMPSAALFHHSLSIPYCHEDKPNVERNDTSHPTTENDTSLFPHKLAELADKTLGETYEGFNPSVTVGIADFLESLTSFLGSGALSFRARLLEGLQRALSLCLKDETRKFDAECGVESRILTACRALSLAVLNVLQASAPHDTSCLQKFEQIICAGLESTHVFIAKRFVEMWKTTFELQKSLAYPETILRALKKLVPYVKLRVPDMPSSGSQVVPTQSPLGLQGKSGNLVTVHESRLKSALDDPFVSCYSEGFNSSPVTRANESPALTTVEKRVQSPLIRRPQLEDTQAQAAKNDSTPPFIRQAKAQFSETNQQHKDSKRNELFTLLDSLRSSPSNTPRKSAQGLFTPPYLRKFQNSDSATGTPRTPTLPAVTGENEGPFLGSSPTPGTRGRTASTASEIPKGVAAQSKDTYFDRDPPSSPPEIRPHNSDDRRKAESPISSNLVNLIDEKTSGGSVEDQNIPKSPAASKSPEKRKTETEQETADVNETSETGESSTRHVSGENPLSNANLAVDSVQDVVHGERAREHNPVGQSDKSVSERKVSGSEAATATNQGPHSGQTSDCAANSSGDDAEMQIASQLEQDIELAADLNGNRSEARSTDSPNSSTKSKKRKRPVYKTPTTPDKERRRSSRIASARISSDNNVQESRAMRAARRSMIFGEPEDSPATTASPVQSAAKRRKLQPRENKDVPTPSKSADGSQSIDDDISDKGSERSKSTPPKTKKSPLSARAASLASRKRPHLRRSPRNAGSSQQEIAHDGNSTPNGENQREGITAKETPGKDNDELQKTLVEGGNRATNESLQSGIPESAAVVPVDTEMSGTNTRIEQNTLQGDSHVKDAEMAPDDHPFSTERMVSRATQAADTTLESSSITEADIYKSLRKVLDDLKTTSLSLSSLREMDDLLFDIRMEAHEASRRHKP